MIERSFKGDPREILKILDYIQENDVRFLRLQFCDLYGRNRNIAVSDTEFETALRSGCAFRASVVPGFETADVPELVLYPNPESMMILPWRPQQGRVARVLCDVCYPDGRIFEGDPRSILKNTLEDAAALGLTFEFSTKIEFFLFELDEKGRPMRRPVDHAGFFDLAPDDKGENTRREIILTLENMGFQIKSSHHELGSGQHEIDFHSADPLTCADNLQTFKTVVKTIAERSGMHASFMPKPLNNEPGSGMHVLIAARQGDRDLFTAEDKRLSSEGHAFAAGIMEHIAAISAVANPTINSYKRLADGFGAPLNNMWKPHIEETLIRVPAHPADERHLLVRSPDAAANPYLLYALLIAAGLDGLGQGLKPEDIPARHLPRTLCRAIESAERDPLFVEVLGEETAALFLNAKSCEWNDYQSTVHDWEIKRYFGTL